MVSHYPAKFCGHTYCGGGDMILIMIVGQDPTCPRLDPS